MGRLYRLVMGIGRLCGHGDAWAWRSLVMGQAAYGRGRAWGHGASVWVVGVPWLWQGEGANGVPIQRNLLNVYPNLELTRYKRHSLIWNSKESKGVPSPT